ncbi:unnamed protein product [Sphagnum balticum]
MALGMNELKMDLLGQIQDGTSSGWIRRDRLKMERTRDGFAGTDSGGNELGMDSSKQTTNPDPSHARPQGASRGHAFIHPEGVHLWVKPHLVVGKQVWGRGVHCLNTFTQYYLRSSPTAQANNFYHLGNDQNYSR